MVRVGSLGAGDGSQMDGDASTSLAVTAGHGQVDEQGKVIQFGSSKRPGWVWDKEMEAQRGL